MCVAVIGGMDRLRVRYVREAARLRNIPVLMRHACGLCTLKDCLRCLIKERGGCVDA